MLYERKEETVGERRKYILQSNIQAGVESRTYSQVNNQDKKRNGQGVSL